MRFINIPNKKSEELAELLGILYGDGYMNLYNKHHYFIEIAGHAEDDFEYHTIYIKNLIKSIFEVTPNFKIRKDQKTLYTQINSKKIFYFLERVGIPKGKKEKLITPPWIKNNPKYFIAFIRGLYDTDGSVILRKRKQNSISLTSKNKRLILDVKSFLEELGYFISYYVDKRMIKEGSNQ